MVQDLRLVSAHYVVRPSADYIIPALTRHAAIRKS